MFQKYPKIHRLGTEENEGILFGKCYLQEKIDGANTSIWFENDTIHCGSRTQEVTDKGFNGFVDYVKNHKGINEYLQNNPTHRLFGEWLVRHTIAYNEDVYKQWYLFDIVVDDKFVPIEQVYEIAKQYNICTAYLFDIIDNPNQEDIQKYVGQSVLGNKGEGVVIKNHTFINKFGETSYAKVVTQQFKEENALVFGGNNKHSDTYWEMYIINQYMTLARIQKIMNKLQPLIDKKLDITHTARIINTAYHDLITEEIWEIQKKVTGPINLKKLGGLAQKKAAKIYHDILNNTLSIAYE